MKIEIWSDVMCPFCYMGKRILESALSDFRSRADIEIIWKSFQLDPSIKYTPGKDLYQYLADKRGQTREWSKRVHDSLVYSAKNVGLTYNFDKVVINNSFDAHRLLQMAKTAGKGDAAEEILFHAYFTEGRDIGNFDTLAGLGTAIGLDREKILIMLNSDNFAAEVRRDIEEAEELGIHAVPTFIFNRKYALVGAQPAEHFKDALEKSFPEKSSAQTPDTSDN